VDGVLGHAREPFGCRVHAWRMKINELAAHHPDWLETDAVLRHFGATRRRAVAAYVDFIRAGVGLPSVWEQSRGEVFISFVERMTAARDADDPKLRGVPPLQRRPLRRNSTLPTTSNFAAGIATCAERDADMPAAYALGGHMLRRLAGAFGAHEVAVDRALRRHAAAVLAVEAGLQ
jgi:putative transposase